MAHLRFDFFSDALGLSTSMTVLLTRAAQNISAANLDAEQARALEQAVGAAALKVTRVSLTDRGRPLEYAETLYRGDRYNFDIVVSREG